MRLTQIFIVIILAILSSSSYGQYWEGDTTGVPSYLINNNSNSQGVNDNLVIQVSLNNSTQPGLDTTGNSLDTTLALTNEIIVEFDLANVSACKFIHLELVNQSVSGSNPCFSRKISIQSLISKGLCVGNHVSIGLKKCLGVGAYKVFVTIEDNDKMLSATSTQTFTI
ncbi:MAG: hypothetical protein HUJ25_11775 [Crocinitomicaceae bacterium]|nr:hypothetical protein [Crocinitomicaceae bacterium]